MRWRLVCGQMIVELLACLALPGCSVNVQRVETPPSLQMLSLIDQILNSPRFPGVTGAQAFIGRYQYSSDTVTETGTFSLETGVASKPVSLPNLSTELPFPWYAVFGKDGCGFKSGMGKVIIVAAFTESEQSKPPKEDQLAIAEVMVTEFPDTYRMDQLVVFLVGQQKSTPAFALRCGTFSHFLEQIAEFYRSQDRNDEAMDVFRRSLGAQARALGGDHPSIEITLRGFSAFLRQIGRDTEADELLSGRATREKLLQREAK